MAIAVFYGLLAVSLWFMAMAMIELARWSRSERTAKSITSRRERRALGRRMWREQPPQVRMLPWLAVAFGLPVVVPSLNAHFALPVSGLLTGAASLCFWRTMRLQARMWAARIATATGEE